VELVSRETLKSEIDNVQEQYLAILYNIIKSFEVSPPVQDLNSPGFDRVANQQEWAQFIDKFAGCLADDPIERGDQGQFEVR
jgi:hypothetical protein